MARRGPRSYLKRLPLDGSDGLEGGDGDSASQSFNRPNLTGIFGYNKPYKLTLPTKWSSETPIHFDQQEQSLLFSKIPGEIRNAIFELACGQCDDPQHVYEKTEFFYRPGYHAKHKSHTALLQTCRRAWIEANDLPMRSAVHTFWFKDKPRRPGWIDRNLYEVQRFSKLWTNLTPTNRTNLRSVRFFTQMYWLEGDEWDEVVDVGNRADLSRGATEMIFTIKHTDWWHWEDNNPLSMKDDWIQRLLARPSFSSKFTKFTLELETLDIPLKLAQLATVIERIKSKHSKVDARGRSNNTWQLRADTGKEILRWTREGNVDGIEAEAHIDLKDLHYRVFSLEWVKL